MLIPLMLRSGELPEWLRGLIPIDWTDTSNHTREWLKLLKVLDAPIEAPAPGQIGSAPIIPGTQRTAAPKFYVYISDSKVNMLYAQGGRRTDSGRNSISKLDSVLSDLTRACCIGTIDEPKEYFAGSLTMRWGPCVFSGVPQLTPSPLVYFGGTTEKTVVGLGGSGRHVIGEVASTTLGQTSFLPSFIFQLQRELGEASLLGESAIPAGDFNGEALAGIYFATVFGKGPTQELEFVAKRLASGPYLGWRADKEEDKRIVLIGTPLYVAMCDL